MYIGSDMDPEGKLHKSFHAICFAMRWGLQQAQDPGGQCFWSLGSGLLGREAMPEDTFIPHLAALNKTSDVALLAARPILEHVPPRLCSWLAAKVWQMLHAISHRNRSGLSNLIYGYVE